MEYTDSDLKRFWGMVDKSQDCWIWTRATSGTGYGIFTVKKKLYLAHRWIYQVRKGDLAAGIVVRHKCDTRACVRPGHLTEGTYSDNLKDAHKRGRHPGNGYQKKTHCPQGHPYSGDNLGHDIRGHRLCKTCRRKQSRRK